MILCYNPGKKLIIDGKLLAPLFKGNAVNLFVLAFNGWQLVKELREATGLPAAIF